MLIQETSQKTGLTKKAIAHYMEHQLIMPKVMDNGYRDFSKEDVARLKKIAGFRRLGLSTAEIKQVLADETGEALQRMSVKKKLQNKREETKVRLLDRLTAGESFEELGRELNALEQAQTVVERLMEIFPGYYGRFICLHFWRFLQESVLTMEQQGAYDEIVVFLDEAADLEVPEELREYLMEHTAHMNTETIILMQENTEQAIREPEKFLAENQENLENYWKYMQSEEYKNSPAYRVQSLLKEFNRISGYNDIFIPAMKRLSSSYAAYYEQLESANQVLLEKYPELDVTAETE